MLMLHTVEYEVRRAGTKPDPYNPDATIEDWNDPEKFKIAGFLAFTSSNENPDGARAELTDSATLTIPDAGADIRRGDVVLDELGRKWQVIGHPSRNKNPFTGWQPTTVCQLTAWQG